MFCGHVERFLHRKTVVLFGLLGDCVNVGIPGQRVTKDESNRKAMNRNWSNQKANPAPKTKAGNK